MTMTILHTDGPPSIDGIRGAITISCTADIVKVECDSVMAGEGYFYVLERKYLPNINKDNALQVIRDLLRHKQTADHSEVCVKFRMGKTPFSIYDNFDSGNKNVIY